MDIFNNVKNKLRLSKWLMALTVLLGFFIFSGTIVGSSQKQQVSQTEIVFVNKQKKLNKLISFTKRVALSNYNFVLSKNLTNKEYLLRFNKLTKVKLIAISKQCFTFNVAVRFVSIKTIPSSTMEDISSAIG